MLLGDPRAVVRRRRAPESEKLRQCVHQILRQLGVKTIADAWIADGAQQMQMLLDVGAAEDAPAQFGAIFGSLLLPEQGIGLDQDPQCVAASTGASTFDEVPGRDLHGAM